MKKIFNEGNQIQNFMSSSGSGTVINHGSGSGSDFLTSYGSGAGSTSQKVTVPTVPVPQHCRHATVMRTDAVKALKELRQCCVYNNEVKSKMCDKKKNPHQILYFVTGAICCYSCRAFFRRSCHRHTTNQILAVVAAVTNQSLDIAAEHFSVIADTGTKQIRAGTLWQNCFHQWLPQTHTDDKSLHFAANNFLQWFLLARNQLEV
jgi:hypothetical protein